MNDDVWTMRTMNGAIVTTPLSRALTSVLPHTLVPKLAAPVRPPRLADFVVNAGTLAVSAERALADAAFDLQRAGPLWGATGLIARQTLMSSVEVRNRRYARIASAFLDGRTGMSYGFLARHVAQDDLRPALSNAEAHAVLGSHDDAPGSVVQTAHGLHLSVWCREALYYVPIPSVSVLCSRSGSDKTRLDVARDILRISLRDGRLVLDTPPDLDVDADCRPSYDTLVIIAHAIGNCVLASVQARLEPNGRFHQRLRERGVGLSHWHGYLPSAHLPPGVVAWGFENPAVPCASHPAALAALSGKIGLLAGGGPLERSFAGDMHIEPQHGTNATSWSCTGLARWLLSNPHAWSTPACAP